MASIPKPQLRGRHVAEIKKNLVVTTIGSILAGLAWKLLYADPKHKKYEEFNKNYNPEERFKIMCDNNLLESCDVNFPGTK